MVHRNFSTPGHIDEALQRGGSLSREEKAGMRNYLGTAISSSNVMTDKVRERVEQIREALGLIAFDEQGAWAGAQVGVETQAYAGVGARARSCAARGASRSVEVSKEIGVESFTLGALGPKESGPEEPVKPEGPFRKWEDLRGRDALELGLHGHPRCMCMTPERILTVAWGVPEEVACCLMFYKPVKFRTRCLASLPLAYPRLSPYFLRFLVGEDYQGDLDEPLKLSERAVRARKLIDKGSLDDPLFRDLSVQEVLAMYFDLREEVAETLTLVLDGILSGRVLYRSRGEGGVYRLTPDAAKNLSKGSLVDLSPIAVVRQMANGDYGQFSAQEIVHGLWGFPEETALLTVRLLSGIFERRPLCKGKEEEVAEIQSVPDKELIRGLVMRGELDHPLVKDLSAAELFAAALGTSEGDAKKHVEFMLRALNGRKVSSGDKEVVKVGREKPSDSFGQGVLAKILPMKKPAGPVEGVSKGKVDGLERAVSAEARGGSVESPSTKLNKKTVWLIAAGVAAAALVAAGLVAVKFKGKSGKPEEDELARYDYSSDEVCSDSDVRDKTGRRLNSLSAKRDLDVNKALLVLECPEEYASSAELIADFERQVRALKASDQVFTDNSPDFNSQSFAPTTGSVDYSYGRGGEDPARYFYVRLPRTAATTLMDTTEELHIWKEEGSKDGSAKLVLNDTFIVGYRDGDPVLVEHDAYFRDPINIGGTNMVKSGILKDLSTGGRRKLEGGLYTLDDEFVYGWKIDEG